MRTTVIHLIGKPGVGKYTIGCEIARLTGARLVDNHSICNPIFNVIAPDGVTPLPPGIWPRVGAVRAAVLDAIVHVSPPELSFVFTNFMRGENAAEYATFLEVVAVAEARGSTMVPVILSCDTYELVDRIGTESRRERMKLIDPVAAVQINEEVPQFSTPHPNLLELDVTRVAPPEAARIIIEWANRCAAADAKE